ncbi:MAG: hypothetical protein ACOYJQ_00725 [Pseudochelatococcus sp.]|jgi:hypothetical protein|uniref:hypothetical protein n=1 Tax=Pseudochelatococcus sp. TaxID=2020869 RepID=UPI003D89C078
MTVQQHQTHTTATDDHAAVAAPRTATAPDEKRVLPSFRALGIPALAAATRRAPATREKAQAPRDLPAFLRQPHYS